MKSRRGERTCIAFDGRYVENGVVSDGMRKKGCPGTSFKDERIWMRGTV